MSNDLIIDRIYVVDYLDIKINRKNIIATCSGPEFYEISFVIYDIIAEYRIIVVEDHYFYIEPSHLTDISMNYICTNMQSNYLNKNYIIKNPSIARQNSISYFYIIPNELICEIMGHLDKKARLCLVKTCKMLYNDYIDDYCKTFCNANSFRDVLNIIYLRNQFSLIETVYKLHNHSDEVKNTIIKSHIKIFDSAEYCEYILTSFLSKNIKKAALKNMVLIEKRMDIYTIKWILDKVRETFVDKKEYLPIFYKMVGYIVVKIQNWETRSGYLIEYMEKIIKNNSNKLLIFLNNNIEVDSCFTSQFLSLPWVTGSISNYTWNRLIENSDKYKSRRLIYELFSRKARLSARIEKKIIDQILINYAHNRYNSHLTEYIIEKVKISHVVYNKCFEEADEDKREILKLFKIESPVFTALTTWSYLDTHQ